MINSSCSPHGDQAHPEGLPLQPSMPFPAVGSPDLIQRDKFGVQPHQVARLRHLVQHEGDEGGMALALLASQGGLCQQHAGFDRVLDCRKRGREISCKSAPLAMEPLPPQTLTDEVVLGVEVAPGVVQDSRHLPAHVKLHCLALQGRGGQCRGSLVWGWVLLHAAGPPPPRGPCSHGLASTQGQWHGPERSPYPQAQ